MILKNEDMPTISDLKESKLNSSNSKTFSREAEDFRNECI